MSEPPGADRPDEEPTINEAGTPGFAIDGTDSFAVPGPGDGAPPEVDDEAAGAVLVSRRRIAATLAAAILLLVTVVALGSAGGDDDRLTGGDELRDGTSVATTEPTTNGGPYFLAPDDAETLARLESGGAVSDTTTYDGMYPVDTTFDQYATDESYDPFDEFDDELEDFDGDDDYVPRYIPSRPRSTRRIVPPRRPPTNTTTTTTVASATTTTAAATTTTQATTTTTTTTARTTTTAVPPRAWEPATTGLGLQCDESVRLFPRLRSLVAAVEGRGLFTTDGARWTALAGGPDVARATALTESASGDRLWVASDRGVFDLTGRTPSEVGDLGAVTSLSVAAGANGPVLLAVSDGTVHRWADGPGAAWTPIAASLNGATPGHVLAIDGQTALIGTDSGVLRTTDGGQKLSPVWADAVVGAPVRVDNNVWWLRPGGAGVLFSGDTGATWTTVNGNGVATAATTLARTPGGLVTTGTAANLVVLADGGVTWKALVPTAPWRPDSVAYGPAAEAMFIATSDCATGTPADASDSVLRLRDAAG